MDVSILKIIGEGGGLAALSWWSYQLWKRNNSLTDSIIEDNSRNITIISGLKSTIEELKEDIKEIKQKTS